jgi:hypothetical protein
LVDQLTGCRESDPIVVEMIDCLFMDRHAPSLPDRSGHGRGIPRQPTSGAATGPGTVDPCPNSPKSRRSGVRSNPV